MSHSKRFVLNSLLACSAVLLLAASMSAGEVDVRHVTLYRDDDGWIADVEISHKDEGRRHFADWIEVDALGAERPRRVVRRDIVNPVADGRERPVYRIYLPRPPASCTGLLFRGHCKVHSYGGLELRVEFARSKGEHYEILRLERRFEHPRPFSAADYFRVPAMRKLLLRGRNRVE